MHGAVLPRCGANGVPFLLSLDLRCPQPLCAHFCASTLYLFLLALCHTGRGAHRCVACAEGTLQACSHSAPGTADCNTSSLVHLNCTNNRTIRLVDLGARYAGRLEVLSNGTWGTVSETFFNLNTASVVCRQLGLPTGLPMFVPEIPQGTGAVLMDQVLCTGYGACVACLPSVDSVRRAFACVRGASAAKQHDV